MVLLEWKVKGYPGKMNEEQLKEFEKELNERGFSSQKEMIKWIYERFGIKYCQQGISNLICNHKILWNMALVKKIVSKHDCYLSQILL